MFTSKFIPMMLVAGAITFTSCSDNDDTRGEETDNGVTTVDRVDPAKVFTGLKPVSVAGMQISYLEDGLVKTITRRASGDNEIASFSYPALARNVSVGKLVRMDVVSGNDRHQFNLRIGDHGFVDYAEETEYDNGKAEETQYWWFSYSDDGHLTSIDRTDEDSQSVKFEYKDGNITRVTVTSRDGEDIETTVSYGSAPTANLGAIMLFDDVFNTDLDEIQFAYYAGLLGKGTASLPVAAQQRTGKYTQNVSFAWNIDNNGYPTSMSPSNEPFDYTFAFK